MRKASSKELVVSGVGITSSIGQGKIEFTNALLEGSHAFGIMKRPGRQQNSSFIGAEIPDLSYPESFSKRLLRSASFPALVSLLTIQEAWKDACLDGVDPYRIGLVIGGSNFQQRELVQNYETYQNRPHMLRPNYAMMFMDTDLCGICTEQFGIRGLAYTIGGASASGNLSVIQAAQAVASGQVDVCIAVGALMDLSYWECHAFRSIGAMGSDRYSDDPASACRPFDSQRDGFIFGESCGVVIIEREDSALKRNLKPYGVLSGWAVTMDGNRNPNPSLEGERAAIEKAMNHAGLSSLDIDYVNPHGSGSLIGDETELKAIENCNLSNACINSTKSVIGHGLTSAGTVELVATLLQMKEARLHPSRNLENPLDPSFNWVMQCAVAHKIRHAISLSIGFGGINTAICLENYN